MAWNRGKVGGFEKRAVAPPIWQVFSAATQHPSHSHFLLDLTLISQHPCLCTSHTFCSFVLSHLCPASLHSFLTIRT